MEKRNVLHEDRRSDSDNEESSLCDAEMHLLIEFFQVLERWDRELGQNGAGRSEVTVCRVQ
jgi:hypothetical protein